MTSPKTFERVLSAEEKAALRGEHFAGRSLVGIDLVGADLRGATFEATSLVACDLTGADLRGANFSRCELRGIVLVDVILGNNRFDGTVLEDVGGLSRASQTLIEACGGTFQPAGASQR